MRIKKSFYRFENGKVSIASLIFYLASFFVMLAIPATIYLLNFPKQDLQSSASVVDFKQSPTLEFGVESAQVRKGEAITININPANANFYRVFYSKYYTDKMGHYMAQLSMFGEIPTSVALITEGVKPKVEKFIPPFSGYIFSTVYQLHNTFTDFKSGDIMCGWDNSMYIYKKHKDSLLNEIISDLKREKADDLGAWEKLAVCNNPGGVKIDVIE